MIQKPGYDNNLAPDLQKVTRVSPTKLIIGELDMEREADNEAPEDDDSEDDTDVDDPPPAVVH